MKHTIRITVLAIVLGLAAACAHKEQPPVQPTSGKTYVPVRR
jgi:hypothetical protein